jgi:hypothetical protein
MTEVLDHVVGWRSLSLLLLVFGLAPGLVLRIIVLAYERDDPRRRELIGELYEVPRFLRPFWVCEQLETAAFESGLPRRVATRLRSLVRRRPQITVMKVVASLLAALLSPLAFLIASFGMNAEQVDGHRPMFDIQAYAPPYAVAGALAAVAVVVVPVLHVRARLANRRRAGQIVER